MTETVKKPVKKAPRPTVEPFAPTVSRYSEGAREIIEAIEGCMAETDRWTYDRPIYTHDTGFWVVIEKTDVGGNALCTVGYDDMAPFRVSINREPVWTLTAAVQKEIFRPTMEKVGVLAKLSKPDE